MQIDFSNPAMATTVSSIGTIFAVLTSIVAIFMSLAEHTRQRRHDRKSVLPIPQIIVGDYEDALYVIVENVGIGPVLFKRVKVTDSKTGKTAQNLIDLLPELRPNFLWDTFVEKLVGRALGPQSSLVLVGLSEEEFGGLEAEFPTVRDEIRLALSDLSISIIATDIYGTEVPECSRSLEWFRRKK